MFCILHLVKNHKIVNNSTATKARAKISVDLESLEFYDSLMSVLLNLKTIKFYLIKLANTSSDNQAI
jgi:hypothetical protein